MCESVKVNVWCVIWIGIDWNFYEFHVSSNLIMWQCEGTVGGRCMWYGMDDERSGCLCCGFCCNCNEFELVAWWAMVGRVHKHCHRWDNACLPAGPHPLFSRTEQGFPTDGAWHIWQTIWWLCTLLTFQLSSCAWEKMRNSAKNRLLSSLCAWQFLFPLNGCSSKASVSTIVTTLGRITVTEGGGLTQQHWQRLRQKCCVLSPCPLSHLRAHLVVEFTFHSCCVVFHFGFN